MTTEAQSGAPAADPWRGIAERYVKLVLAIGQHDSDYVDAFYGPAEWKAAAAATKVPLLTLDQEAAALEGELTKAVAPSGGADGSM